MPALVCYHHLGRGLGWCWCSLVGQCNPPSVRSPPLGSTFTELGAYVALATAKWDKQGLAHVCHEMSGQRDINEQIKYTTSCSSPIRWSFIYKSPWHTTGNRAMLVMKTSAEGHTNLHLSTWIFYRKHFWTSTRGGFGCSYPMSWWRRYWVYIFHL
jgi:hypothetical protein